MVSFEKLDEDVGQETINEVYRILHNLTEEFNVGTKDIKTEVNIYNDNIMHIDYFVRLYDNQIYLDDIWYHSENIDGYAQFISIYKNKDVWYAIIGKNFYDIQM